MDPAARKDVVRVVIAVPDLDPVETVDRVANVVRVEKVRVGVVLRKGEIVRAGIAKNVRVVRLRRNNRRSGVRLNAAAKRWKRSVSRTASSSGVR